MSHPARHTLARAAMCCVAGAAGLLGTAAVAQAADTRPAASSGDADVLTETVNGVGRAAVDVVNEAGVDVAPRLSAGGRALTALATG
ncbi:hypothetical protein [Streptomyces profundus]|uniref:hypothetical protein n=1 Tax=Streptomyces profundus TaxID=2867410 RepID=UPI001D163608|nr:hypothetical protein [Streptomyces sp. MA3_2.13]UED84345.1 hypothetical protein K4G22_09115 [Streptomyces sp. MA3_2.13]